MPKVMNKSAWQHEQERIEALKARIKFEDEEKERMIKANLEKAIVEFEAAVGEAKVLAERALFRAKACNQRMREDKGGATPDMECACGCVKGRGAMCLFCDRVKCALYGGDDWIKYGICNSSYYRSPYASYYHSPEYIFENAVYYGF